MAKNRIGRPTKLTPKVQEAICTAIEYGAPLVIAAKHGGVHDETVLNWRKAGEELQRRLDAGESPEMDVTETAYLAFFVAVEAANARAMLFHLQNLADNAHINPQNSMWMLERRWPEHFGRPVQKTELSGANGAPVATEIIIRYADDNDSPAASGAAADTP